MKTPIMNNEDAISRTEALAKVKPDEYYHSNEVRAMLEDLPSAPPQVAHGRWIWNPDHCKWACSVCGGMEGECESPICKWCGAKMDGGEDDAAR